MKDKTYEVTFITTRTLHIDLADSKKAERWGKNVAANKRKRGQKWSLHSVKELPPVSAESGS